MTRDEWIERFAATIGVAAPSPEEVEALLALAAAAAHQSERTAAPIACWLAATAQLSPRRAVEIAEQVSPQQ